MGSANPTSSAFCCQTPISTNLIQNPTFQTTQSQLILYLKAYPKVGQILTEKDLMKEVKQLVQNCEPRQESDGSYIGEVRLKIDIPRGIDSKQNDKQNQRQKDNSPINTINTNSHNQKQFTYTKSGKGIFISKEGQFYYGLWHNNLRSSQGLLIYPSGDCYIGNFFQNEPHGNGIYQGKNPQRKYQGCWQSGLQHGIGTQYYSDGSFFTGQFIQGMKQGKGKMVYKDGTFYEGEFIKDKIYGQGIFSGQHHRYEGQWVNNKMHGTGKSQWFNQKSQVVSSYIGEYQNGVKNGFGEYRWGKGRTYKGKWENGEIKNTGVLMDIQSPHKLSRNSVF